MTVLLWITGILILLSFIEIGPKKSGDDYIGEVLQGGARVLAFIFAAVTFFVWV